MPYTGDVRVGGSPDVRDLEGLRIAKIAVGRMDNNAYLLECRATGARCLIDAAAEPDRLLGLIGSGALDLVVTTHRHADHWQALAPVVEMTGARTAAGRDDADAIPVPTADVVGDGDRLRFGDVFLEAISLVGHTPGSVALLYEPPAGGGVHVFTGDSLFSGGVGRTTSAADFDSLLGDVIRKLFDRLPDDTWVYPGHGRDTTLGAERPQLPEWRSRGW
ncbi:MAG: MBL fold metallo-hydrolase [Actinomycetota bacterium]|nr:MBL fold metallo-hydrolase [Actinomycetota bacterium]